MHFRYDFPAFVQVSAHLQHGVDSIRHNQVAAEHEGRPLSDDELKQVRYACLKIIVDCETLTAKCRGAISDIDAARTT